MKSLSSFLKAKLQQREISKREYDARATVENFKAENLLTGPSRKPFKEKTKLVEVIHNTELFESTLVKLLTADKSFRQQFPNLQNYLDGIKIKDISEITSRSKKRKSEAEEMLRDGNQISMYHSYIDTELEESHDSFYETIHKEGIFEDECWINSLNDHYKNTLMSPNKWKSKRLTREKVLELIGKTYEDFKEHGASVEEMKPVFEYFKFPVKIYNCWGYMFSSYDPEIRNKNIPAFFGLVKDNHIYTLNSNIMSLARKNIQMNFTCNASRNFIFNRNDKTVEYKVFNTIDDILPILRQCEKNKDDDKEFNLIHSENTLMQIFCDLKRVGYTPFITSMSEIRVLYQMLWSVA